MVHWLFAPFTLRLFSVMAEVVGHAPLLLGLMLANLNNQNNPNEAGNIAGGGAIPGTVVAHKQVLEVKYLDGRSRLIECNHTLALHLLPR